MITLELYLRLNTKQFMENEFQVCCIAHVGCITKISDHSNLKILSPKQMLQRLPIILAQVKTGNTPENLLNEIRQIIYSLHKTKEITKQSYITI